MMAARFDLPVIDPRKCQMCDRCVARQSCRLRAIVQMDAREMPYIDRALCRGCAVCAPACPHQAIVRR